VICARCGNESRRDAARFCSKCGTGFPPRAPNPKVAGRVQRAPIYLLIAFVGSAGLCWLLYAKGTDAPVAGTLIRPEWLARCQVAVGALAALTLGLIFSGLSSQCPKCRWWWARTEVARKLLDKWQTIKFVRTTSVQYRRGSDGVERNAGHSEHVHPVAVTKRKYEVRNRCYKCGHQWLREEEK